MWLLLVLNRGTQGLYLVHFPRFHLARLLVLLHKNLRVPQVLVADSVKAFVLLFVPRRESVSHLRAYPFSSPVRRLILVGIEALAVVEVVEEQVHVVFHLCFKMIHNTFIPLHLHIDAWITNLVLTIQASVCKGSGLVEVVQMGVLGLLVIDGELTVETDHRFLEQSRVSITSWVSVFPGKILFKFLSLFVMLNLSAFLSWSLSWKHSLILLQQWFRVGIALLLVEVLLGWVVHQAERLIAQLLLLLL